MKIHGVGTFAASHSRTPPAATATPTSTAPQGSDRAAALAAPAREVAPADAAAPPSATARIAAKLPWRASLSRALTNGLQPDYHRLIPVHETHRNDPSTAGPTLTKFLATLAALCALAGGAALASPAPAAAAPAPCWKQLINDWFDGRIDRVYPLHCYRQAIDNLPEDVEVYSSARDDIRRAMLAAIRQDRGGGGPSPERDIGIGPLASGNAPGGRDDEESRGVFGSILDAIGPKNADAIPLPLLILASIAFLLLAAAAASYAARRIQARRLPKPGPGRP